MKLREVLESDLEIFFEQQADPATKAMAGHPGRKREAFFLHMRQRVLPQVDGLIRTIEVDGKPAGNVVAWLDEGQWFLGYVLGRDFWGKGYASAAVTAFLPLVPHRPLYADVAPHNVASRRVLEKNGFQLIASNEDSLEFMLPSPTGP